MKSIDRQNSMTFLSGIQTRLDLLKTLPIDENFHNFQNEFLTLCNDMQSDLCEAMEFALNFDDTSNH